VVDEDAVEDVCMPEPRASRFPAVGFEGGS
jgi:hypothetical protein